MNEEEKKRRKERGEEQEEDQQREQEKMKEKQKEKEKKKEEKNDQALRSRNFEPGAEPQTKTLFIQMYQITRLGNQME